jgi:chemotaxis methyl-accepting protein methylase
MLTLEATEPILDDVVAWVRRAHGIDFGGYRRGTILRRLAFRMIRVGARTGPAYLEALRRTPDEAARLVEQLTVKVSRFYRNAPMFDRLGSLLPDLAVRVGDAPLRGWSAGCGHGEEAYTLAMLLADLGGQVHGSDVDDTALAAAPRGVYAAGAAVELPEALARRWLHRGPADTVQVHATLRTAVHFVHHDLTAERATPLGLFHVICCRNVLIYLTPRVQERVLDLLVHSLAPDGLLCLGEAEWIARPEPALALVDRKLRIFRRTSWQAGPT